MAITSEDALETNGRDGGGSDGRGDVVAITSLEYFQAPGRVCFGAQNCHSEHRTFFSDFVPISYPLNTHV